MNILGLNACLIDDDKNIAIVDGGGICVFKDNEIQFAITEERLSRIKYGGGFTYAVPYVLDSCGLTIDDIDMFVASFYGVEFEVPIQLTNELKNQLGLSSNNNLEVISSHHLAHAYSSYYPSGFKKSLVVISDNEGQIIGKKKSRNLFENACERNSYYIAIDGELELIARDFDYPFALGSGKLYNKFTRYLGLGNYHNAGKTMGLASYGSGRFGNLRDAWFMDHDSRLHCIVPDTGDFRKDVQAVFSKLGVSIPGPREQGEPLRQIHADMAEYIQEQLNRSITAKVSYLLNEYNLQDVCVGGGVALNCNLNTEISNLPNVRNVFAPIAPQDQGLCIGNALYGLKKVEKQTSYVHIPLYLGRDYDLSLDALKTSLISKGLYFREIDDLADKAAELLYDGKIIGFFQGKSEFGPRALGNRSILANPLDSLVVNRLNLEVKKRESFRPFAPSVLSEKSHLYFDGFNGLSPSMMFVASIKEEFRRLVPGITHVDGTSRLQTVDQIQNPIYHKLISAFGSLTGIYMVLNTSFNLDGMPIVETPEEAMECFKKSTLDALIIGNVLAWK